MKMWTTIGWGLLMVALVVGFTTVWLVAMIHGGVYGR